MARALLYKLDVQYDAPDSAILLTYGPSIYG